RVLGPSATTACVQEAVPACACQVSDRGARPSASKIRDTDDANAPKASRGDRLQPADRGPCGGWFVLRRRPGRAAAAHGGHSPVRILTARRLHPNETGGVGSP